ncbi:MAG: hypothetical protein Q7S40_14655 [Opitutaceae bacterium]|nr:hypothetical protein [Opitutaceae bacterium]
MAALSLLARKKRHAVLCNLTDHVLHVARISRLDERPVLVDSFAELPLGDDAALAQWLEATFPDRGPGYMPAYCGFHPPERVLVRENINTRRLEESNYLENLLAESAKLTAVKDWQVCALQPTDGVEFNANIPSRPGLLFGVPRSAARETQQRLCRAGLLPRRLELGSVALLGALTRHLRDAAYANAVVACEIGRTQTRIYFLARDGVHTPPPLPHGLRSIEESAMKELGVPDVASARIQLENPAEELRSHSRRLVRMLTRHLKPAIDYFEMQTGQPIGALFCAHLPATLGWLEEALSSAVELEFLVPDYATGLGLIGLELAPDAAFPHRSWFQALSLVGELAVAAAPAAPAAHEAKT